MSIILALVFATVYPGVKVFPDSSKQLHKSGLLADCIMKPGLSESSGEKGDTSHVRIWYGPSVIFKIAMPAYYDESGLLRGVDKENSLSWDINWPKAFKMQFKGLNDTRSFFLDTKSDPDMKEKGYSAHLANIGNNPTEKTMYISKPYYGSCNIVENISYGQFLSGVDSK